MNKSFIFIGTIWSLVSGVIAFVVLQNYIIAAAVFVLFIAYFLFANQFLVKKYYKEQNKIHECYNFVDNFIVSLSVNNSYQQAFESATLGCIGELKEEINHIESQTYQEKTYYLKQYFNSSSYDVFLKILSLYEEQGGNILSMSEMLMGELTRNETSVIEFEKKMISKLVEFIILWVLSYGILIFVKVALRQFYDQILENNLFTISICFYFLFVIVSLHLMLSTCFKKKRRVINE